MVSQVKKKIAVVIPKYGLVGGSENFAFQVTERLALCADFELHVFANRWRKQSGKITFHKVPVISFPRTLTSPSFAYLANKKIAEIGCDLIHSHERILQADIFTLHCIPHEIWVNAIRQKRMSLFDRATCWVENRMIRKGGCERFLPVSSLAMDYFARCYHVPRQSVEIIHPGIDLEKFQLAGNGANRNEVRDSLGIRRDERVILFVSMNFELKGLAQIMDAMALNKKQDPSAPVPRLLVVGKGNEKKFQAHANSLGLGDNVIFTGVWQSSIEKLYWASDIFMMLSGFDTFGMAVLEAMAASLPVIVSTMVGAKDIVVDGVNGFVVERDDIAKISEKIRLLVTPELGEKMGQAALAEAKKHSWDRIADRMATIYRELLN
ncbi:MAG: glycosyltransferase family 4 protein [Desulfobulbaceae bacterium]|nr:glycosyltransferase family 4 protein [Desulfobulbaceae bacterium]HIJ79555.1 glycosyltransferase family 4 protein [Deltaproteobacteria bacterium]